MYEWLFVSAHVCTCIIAHTQAHQCTYMLLKYAAPSFSARLGASRHRRKHHVYITRCHVCFCPILSLHIVCRCEREARPQFCSSAGLSLVWLCVGMHDMFVDCVLLFCVVLLYWIRFSCVVLYCCLLQVSHLFKAKQLFKVPQLFKAHFVCMSIWV